MKKYLTIIDTFWQRALTYRFTVFAYRVGEVVETISLIVLWSAIYQNIDSIGGFTKNEMITYILVGNVFKVLVRNFLPGAIDRDIREGKLSLFLVRPIEYFQFILVKEIGRISVATIMSTSSQLLVMIIFLNDIIININILPIFVIVVMLIFAFLTELLLSYIMGLIAFWTDESDALHTTLDRLKRLFSGTYFPLSILPQTFVTASFLFPFAYSFYIPTQLYLGKIDVIVGVQGILVQIAWIAVLWILAKLIWKLGLKRYEAVGI